MSVWKSHLAPSARGALAVGVFLFAVQVAEAQTCTVPSPTYATVQAAVDDPACPRVFIAAGTYEENLQVARQVVIIGESRDEVIIDGAGLAPAIRVGPGILVVLNSLTATNGFNTVDGGGVDARDRSLVVLSRVLLTGNTARAGAGAYTGGGTLVVLDSVIADNVGGGLSAPPGSFPARIVIRDSVVTNNVLSVPAAVYADELTMQTTQVSTNQGQDAVRFFTGSISDSHIVGNLADTGICAVRVSQSGTIDGTTVSDNVARFTGGVCNDGRLTITNSTITNNTGLEEAGAIAHTLPLDLVETTVQFTTIADNVGPLADAIGMIRGEVRLRGSIVSGPTPGHVCRSIDSGRFVSLGSNVGTDQSCGLTRDSDQAGVSDAGLDVLANNGGPTPTRALLPGSVAVDGVASDNCPDVDQRGVARPQGAACDVGAYEVE